MKKDLRKQKKCIQPDLFGTVHSPSDRRQSSGYAVMHCDGASSGNPGKSGIGVIISLSDEDANLSGTGKDIRISEYIGIATNNIAEYSALLKGLEKARSLGLKKIKVFLDSELLVRQMNGVYKVKNEKLIPLWTRAREILSAFDDCSITHVGRELNGEADYLARQGIKKAGHM